MYWRGSSGVFRGNYCLAQLLPIRPIPCIRQRRQELHIADQVRQAELKQHAELTPVATVGREVVTAQDAIELRAQHLNQHVTATGRIDLEQSVQAGAKAPGPHPRAALLMAGLIDIESRL